MKKILYVKLTSQKPHRKKGFLATVKDKFFTEREDAPEYTVQNIYDERNITIGYYVEYYLSDISDYAETEKYYGDIHQLSAQYSAAVAFEDISSALDYPYEHYDGSGYVLEKEIISLKEKYPAFSDEFTGIITDKDTDISLLKKISDESRYIIIYAKERTTAEYFSMILMEYNSTASIITDKLTDLFHCPAVMILCRDFSYDHAKMTDHVISPYMKFFSQPENVKFHAYLDNFFPVMLSAAFSEAVSM